MFRPIVIRENLSFDILFKGNSEDRDGDGDGDGERAEVLTSCRQSNLRE